MECPFKVGDRIESVYPQDAHHGPATVTVVDAEGFEYKMDRTVYLGVRIGSYDQGRCLPFGYPGWKRLDESASPAGAMEPDPSLVVYSETRWVPKPTGRRYDSVDALMQGEGVSQEVQDEVHRLRGLDQEP